MDGIQYQPSGEWFDMSEWVEEDDTSSEKVVKATKSLYDLIVCQSKPEREFAETVEKRTDIRFFVKLPDWFKVPTPVGNYNPDWALVMENTDQHGDLSEGEPLLYLVRETKSTLNEGERRTEENQKVHCGKRHFDGALGVNFRVVTSADELP